MFKGKQIRKILLQNEWWFSVVDVCEALTSSIDAGAYWRKLKQRLTKEGSEVVTFCHGLKLTAPDGKKYETDCANTEGMFRIVQSIPSPKAEPLKRWLAHVGYERVQEIENPELATKRTRMLYKLKGYPEDWIEKRMRGIVIREELTEEWQKRGAENKKDYEILTAEISKATFGVTPSEYKELKGLKRENLRRFFALSRLSFPSKEEPRSSLSVILSRAKNLCQSVSRRIRQRSFITFRMTREHIRFHLPRLRHHTFHIINQKQFRAMVAVVLLVVILVNVFQLQSS